jgi:hypothetical protein
VRCGVGSFDGERGGGRIFGNVLGGFGNGNGMYVCAYVCIRKTMIEIGGI